MDDVELEARRTVYLAECMQLIDTYGWMVQGVFPREDTPPEEQYSFNYTVGLSAKGLPEFIAYGLDLDVGKIVLNQLAQRAIDGEQLRPGTIVSFQNDYEGVLLLADDLSDLTLARHFYPIVRAFQLVFQDDQHRWPNDPNYGHPGLPILGRFPTTFHRKEVI